MTPLRRSDRLAAWLGHGVSAALVAHMMAIPRLARRCDRIVDERLGPASPSATQALALALDPPGLAALVWRAGVVWHARAIAAVIDGREVRALAERLGPDIRRLALRFVAVAPAGIEPVVIQRFDETALDSGAACLETWCDAQPPAVGQRLALRLPPALPLSPMHRASGPQIVDALLGADVAA